MRPSAPSLVPAELGFGASPLGGVFGDVDEAESILAVHRALELGIRYFDVAPYYGSTRAETVLGRALRDVDRRSFEVSTKVGRYGANAFDFSADRVHRSLDESYARLGIECADIVFVHDVEFGDPIEIIDVTLPALLAEKQAGRVKRVGISGLPLSALRFIAERFPVDVVLSYCRYTLLDSFLEHWIWPPLSSHGELINASPFAMGLLTTNGPMVWHPAHTSTKAACKQAVDICVANGLEIEELALSFSLRCPTSRTLLVGMADRMMVNRNIEWASRVVHQRQVNIIRHFLKKCPMRSWPSGNYSAENG